MTDAIPASGEFIDWAVATAAATRYFDELAGSGPGAPYLELSQADEPAVSAGFLRLWRGTAAAPLDRMVYLRLVAGPVTTQLLFVFGRPGNRFPHMHAQVVSFPPDGIVYNMDLLPRVDPVEDYEWFQRVYAPLRRPYRRATGQAENSCAQAPANPALAILMSPWGIASQRTDAQELERVMPQLREYVEHYLGLAAKPGWEAPDATAQVARDAKQLGLFFSDELDPRAWAGVYRVVGEDTGTQIKAIMATPLGAP
jgi:hypothetical protein